MTNARILGVLGGMGPLAGATFMQRLTLLTPADRDQDHIPSILWSDPRVPDRTAARLSGVRVWQVHLALYTLSSVIAGVTGLLYLGQIKTASLSLALPLDLPSVAAAVIGGTSIFGGRGGFGGTIVGALILTVLTSMLTLMQIPEGGRRILFGLIILAVTALFIRLTDRS